MAGQLPKDSLDLQSTSSDSDIDMSSQEGAAAAAAHGEASTSGPKMVEETNGDLPDAIDRILERNRSEIMFELRRMKMGDRPVTGHGHKETLENFFQRQSDETAVNEEHRPEAVVVEVQGLVERRPVSSVLQSAGFRRRLENALRSSFATVSSRQSTASPVPRQPSASPSPRRQESAAGSRPLAPSLPPVLSPGQNGATSIPPPPPPPPLMDDEPRVARAAAWLTQQTEPLPEDPVERQFMAVHDTYREGIIEEVSELVQRQLVTSTLDGEFRATLESRVASHLSATGADGPRVQQFIQSLPSSGLHQRNDFSHLGISAADQMAAALSDEVSVISATAAVHVSQNHVSRAVSLELASLRSQVSELKSMMRLSFDLQLDIQRAIRQEVSAAVSSALAGPNAAAPATGATASSRPVNDSSCLICLDRATDSVLYQCGHMCVCYTCGLTLKQRGAHCPMCRAPIRDIIRAYRCNQE